MGKKANTPRILPGQSKATLPEVEQAEVIQDDVPITELIKITEDDRPAAIMLAFKDDALKIIADKKAEYGKLAIAGIDDKEGYNAVKAAMGEMKNSRLVFARAADEHILTPMKIIVEEVKGNISEIIDGFKEVESDLRAKKDAIDDEKERLKEEERLAAIRRVQERTVKLVELGATSDGMVYSFYYSQMLYITAANVQDMEQEQFDVFLSDVQVEYDKEQTRKQEAEQARIDEENDRLIKQAELEKQIEIHNTEKEALRQRIGKLRLKELKMLGAEEQDDHSFKVPGKPFHLVPIEGLIDTPDEEWEKLVADIENYVVPMPDSWVNTPEPVKDSFADQVSEAINEQHETQIDLMLGIEKPSEQLSAEDEVLTQIAAEEDQLGQTIDEDLVELTMRFFESEPYTDIAITPRRTMRFYPDEFTEQANAGVDPLAGWKVQNLNCIIFDNVQS